MFRVRNALAVGLAVVMAILMTTTGASANPFNKGRSLLRHYPTDRHARADRRRNRARDGDGDGDRGGARGLAACHLHQHAQHPAYHGCQR